MQIEIVKDENGKVLWYEKYVLRGIHYPGETFIQNYICYTVLKSAITKGKLGNIMVEYIVSQGKL